MLGRSILLGLSAISCAAAQLGQGSTVLTFTRVPNPVTAGQPQAITYATNDTVTPVSIVLRKGSAANLETISTLTSSAHGGQYIWTPSSELENGSDYALEITQGTQTNYYGPFALQGGGDRPYSSSASSSSSNAPGMPTGFPTMGGAGNSSTMRNSTMSRNSTMTSTPSSSMTTSMTTGTSDMAAPTDSAPTTSSPSASPSGGAGNMLQVGSGVAMVFGGFAALLL